MLSILEVVHYYVTHPCQADTKYPFLNTLAKLSKEHNTHRLKWEFVSGVGRHTLEKICKATYVANIHSLRECINTSLREKPFRFNYSPEFIAICELVGGCLYSQKEGGYVLNEKGEDKLTLLVRNYYRREEPEMQEKVKLEVRKVLKHAQANIYQNPDFYDSIIENRRRKKKD